MLSKIKLILWLFILLAVAYFVSMNTQPSISVKILPTLSTPEMPLALIIIISMIIGALIIILMALSDWMAFQVEKLKIKRQLNLTKDELEKCKKENQTIKEENEKLKKELEIERKKQNIKVEEENQDQDQAL
jgi:type III secretory pathway component EscU